MASREAWARELLMRPDDRRRSDPRENGEDRLTVRQAIVVWLIAAVAGWLVTVGAVYLAVRVF